VHELIDFCRSADIRFSVGFDLSAAVQEAITEMPDGTWVAAILAGPRSSVHRFQGVMPPALL
jgi:hypothetical protein